MSIAQLASLLAELSRRLSVAPATSAAALDTVMGATRRALPQSSSVTLTLLGEHGPTTAAATDDLGRAVDEHQYRLREGPCLYAAGTGETVSVPSLATGGQRWPELARYATGVGLQSVLSVGIPPPARASLNLYSSRPSAFAEESEHVARVLASYASVIVRCGQLHQTGPGGAGGRRPGRWRRRRRSGAAGVLGPLLSCPACGMAILLNDGARKAIDEARLQCPSRSCGFIFKRAW